MKRVVPLLLAGWTLGCGGATPSGSTTGPDEDPAALTEQAEEAWRALDPDAAASLAERAVAAGGGTVALEIAARADLAAGRDRAALEVLSSASSPHLRHLRARARAALGDWAGAAADLEDDDDPWAEAVRPAFAAIAGREAYRIQGDTTAIALEPLPLPVVRVTVDGVQTLAVLSAGAERTILDPSLRARGGAIDELAIGDLTVSGVPHTVRPLSALSDALGVTIGAALGLDLLLRLHARIDGPGGRLTLSRAGTPPAEGSSTAPFVTPTGAFLALPARLADTPVWLTVDTTGVYPVALAPGAEEALGAEPIIWEPAAGVGQAILPAQIGDMAIEGLPVIRGVLDEDHARGVGAPVAGAIGWGLLAQLITRFDPEHRRLIFE